MGSNISCKSTSVHLFGIHSLLLFITVSAQSRPLAGLELRCCTLVEDPVTFEEKNEKHIFDFGGLAIDYLTVMQEKLGFRCKSLELFKARNESNQGATGFVLELEECTQNGTIRDSPGCQCDLGVGGWARNDERLGRVDFVLPFATDDFRMITHVDNIKFASPGGAFFITAFAPTAWIAIFGLIACFIFLKLFHSRFTPPDPSLLNLPADAKMVSRIKHYFVSTRLRERLINATKKTLLEMIGQSTSGIQAERMTCRYWLLTYVLLLCGIFLVLAYEAAMTASLVQEVASSEFRAIDDLKTCRVPASDVCIPGGGAVEALWNSLVASQPCQEGAANPTVITANNYDEGHRRVADKRCKFFLASGATTRGAENGRYCGKVTTTGEPFSPSGLSCLLPKGSNLTDIFNRATLQLHRSDGIDTLDRFFRKRGECAKVTDVALSFRRLKPFFVSAFTACLLMFLLMIVFPEGKEEQAKEEQAKEEQAKERGDNSRNISKTKTNTSNLTGSESSSAVSSSLENV